jgi:hypothetical protein
MAETRRSTVVAVFPTVEQAELAVRELLQTGFSRDKLGLFVRDTGKDGIEMQRDAAHYRHEAATRTVTGTVAGTVLGGLFGTLTAILLPGIGTALAAGIFVAGCVATGALAGGFTGLMSTVGLSEEESHWFQGQLESGRPIVAVEANNRYSEALAIMEIHGAYDMTRERYTGTTPPELPVEAN